MKLIAAFIIPVIFFGCTQNVNFNIDPPEDLILHDQMVDIVVDLMLYDAILVDKQKKRSDDIDFSKYFMHNSIMDKYEITRERFERSFIYYQKDFEKIDQIYADALTKLSKMQSEIESK